MKFRRPLSVCLLALLALAGVAKGDEPAGSARILGAVKDERVKMAMLGLTSGAGIDQKMLATIEELVLGALDSTGALAVTGKSDIATVLGFEQQRQILGCDTDSGCLAEIAGALGVGFVVSGDVGRLGSVTIVSLKVIDARKASVVARARKTVESDSALPRAIDEAANEIARVIGPTSPRLAVAPQTTGARHLGAGFWALIGSSVVATGTGAYLGVATKTSVESTDTAVDRASFDTARAAATRNASLATISYIVAGAAALGAATVFVLSGDHARPIAIAPTAEGVVLSGLF